MLQVRHVHMCAQVASNLVGSRFCRAHVYAAAETLNKTSVESLSPNASSWVLLLHTGCTEITRLCCTGPKSPKSPNIIDLSQSSPELQTPQAARDSAAAAPTPSTGPDIVVELMTPPSSQQDRHLVGS